MAARKVSRSASAITISGAAASPNMGYHSSPFVTFILTLLNARLGAWLGNPGQAGDHTFLLGYPESSVQPIVDEALGLTEPQESIRLSLHGGHFENLGLYEMVLRRCHFIVVSDAGSIPNVRSRILVNRYGKIRGGFWNLSSTTSINIYPRSQIDAAKQPGHKCAIGRIRYSAVDGSTAPDGVIVYIKPACYGNEPRDIDEYFKRRNIPPPEHR